MNFYKYLTDIDIHARYVFHFKEAVRTQNLLNAIGFSPRIVWVSQYYSIDDYDEGMKFFDEYYGPFPDEARMQWVIDTTAKKAIYTDEDIALSDVYYALEYLCGECKTKSAFDCKYFGNEQHRCDASYYKYYTGYRFRKNRHDGQEYSNAFEKYVFDTWKHATDEIRPSSRKANPHVRHQRNGSDVVIDEDAKPMRQNNVEYHIEKGDLGNEH